MSNKTIPLIHDTGDIVEVSEKEAMKLLLSGPWSHLWPIIQDHLESVVDYCINVKRERWLEVEPWIIEDGWTSIPYATHVIKGRWLECEEQLLELWAGTNMDVALSYAIHIIGERWPEYEKVCLERDTIPKEYCENFGLPYKTAEQAHFDELFE